MKYTTIYSFNDKVQINDSISPQCSNFKYLGKNSVTKKTEVVDLNNATLIETNNTENVYYMGPSCNTMCQGLSSESGTTYYTYPLQTWMNTIFPTETPTYTKLQYSAYCSSNYTLLGAISMSQQPITSTTPMPWYYCQSHYFLKHHNSDLFTTMHFATVETQKYAIDNWDFVPYLISGDASDGTQYYSYDTSLSLNQGLGCGNLISSTKDLANVLLHVLHKDISGISPDFIGKYITPKDMSSTDAKDYYYRKQLFDNSHVINWGATYTAGLSQYLLTEYSSFNKQRLNVIDKSETVHAPILETADSYKNLAGNLYWGHEGESYGVSSFMVGGHDISSNYIITACSTINMENAKIVDEICELVLKTLVKDPSNSPTNRAIFSKWMVDNTNINTDYVPTMYKDDIWFSLSYIIYDISGDTSTPTVIIMDSSGNYWNEQSIDGDNSGITFNYGSCGSKLCTALDTIIMMNDICHNAYHEDAVGLFQKLQNTEAYELLNNQVTDNNLITKQWPPTITNNQSYPNSSTTPIGFKHIFKNTFFKENMNDPAIKTGWLPLQRLIYMNTPLNDFDQYPGSSNILGKVVCPYGDTTKTDCNCYGADYNFVGTLQVDDNNNKKTQNKWMSNSFGPFQWLQMANTCDSNNKAILGKWKCSKDNGCTEEVSGNMQYWNTQQICQDACELTCCNNKDPLEDWTDTATCRAYDSDVDLSAVCYGKGGYCLPNITKTDCLQESCWCTIPAPTPVPPPPGNQKYCWVDNSNIPCTNIFGNFRCNTETDCSASSMFPYDPLTTKCTERCPDWPTPAPP